jgi:hypothetical protein
VWVFRKQKAKSRFHSSCYSNISINLVSVWDVNFVLFNSMLRYMINGSMHAFFHVRTVIIPQPMSARGLSELLSSRENDIVHRVKALAMITVMIWKRGSIYLYVIDCCLAR